MAAPSRKYPLKQPDGHEPKIPRYWIQLSSSFKHIYTAYIGIQRHGGASAGQYGEESARAVFNSWVSDPEVGPELWEHFVVVGGDKADSKVWVAYWTDEEHYRQSLANLQLSKTWASLGTAKENVGLWCEAFETLTDRFETIYSGTDYQPGWAKLPQAQQVGHKYTAYWGAMRDRIPESANDKFEEPSAETVQAPKKTPKGLKQRLVGKNYDNMAHIRSGQYWQRADTVEAEAYEKNLEPTLMKGLNYLWDNAANTGCVGLRFLRNVRSSVSKSETAPKETCAAGFFRNLADLEDWSEKHPTHRSIYGGLTRHAMRFGPDRNLRTWHEVSVLKEGEAHFEYVNCSPETGAVRFIEMDAQALSS